MSAPTTNGASGPSADAPPVRVVIVDDQELVRAAFRVLLESQPDLVVVGEAADGEQALALLRDVTADVVLMDVRMPRMDGATATRLLIAERPRYEGRVLVLTTFGTEAHVDEALRAGAAGFLLKDAGPARLFEAVRLVAAGQGVLDPAVTRRVLSAYTRLPSPARAVPGAIGRISEREREVLGLVALGLGNDAVAARLFISPTTAKKHVSNIMTKLGARDRAHLVALAYQSGMVAPPS